MRYMRLIDLELISVCKKGDARAVKKLLRKGADPNCQSYERLDPTPILIAAEYGHHEIIPILIKYGAQPNSVDFRGKNALHYAVKNGQYDTVKYLITQLHLDPNIKDRDGITPFLIATENGDIKMLKLLIELGANPHIADYKGRNALHYAVINGYYPIAEYLLTQLHLDPNAQDEYGMTPFLIAIPKGDIDMLKLLIKFGANPYIVDHEGEYAVHYAVERRYEHIVEYLLTQLKLDPNIKDNDGITPFIRAAQKGDIRMLKLLLQLGADPSIPDKDGKTALHYAVQNRRYDIAQYLITQLQLDPNTKDHNGITPFMIAAQNGDIAMLQLLLQHGANPYITDHQGQNALHYAVKNGQYDTAQYLITQLHLNPNTQDNDGITPFMIATENFDSLMLQRLIQLGTHPNIPNHQGQTHTPQPKRKPLKKLKPSTITL